LTGFVNPPERAEQWCDNANLCRRIACEPRGTLDVRLTALEAAAQHGVPLSVATFCYSETGDVLAQRCGAPDLRRRVILTSDGVRKAARLAAAAFLAIELSHQLASSFRPI